MDGLRERVSWDCVRAEGFIPDRLTREAKKVLRSTLKREEGAVHIWRHSALTLMLQKGADIETVRRVAGHSSLTVTQRYVHSNDVVMLQAMSQLKAEYKFGENVSLGGTEAPKMSRQKVNSKTKKVRKLNAGAGLQGWYPQPDSNRCLSRERPK